jgi:hypothetical protein
MNRLSLRWCIIVGSILASLIPSTIFWGGHLYRIQSAIENGVVRDQSERRA